MSSCTNPGMRERLSAYELAMLSDEERQELELHLYECDACYRDLEQFADWIDFLKYSRQVRESVLADDARQEPESKSSSLTRLLIAVAAVLVLAVPAYLF